MVDAIDRPTANDPVRSVTAFEPEMITPRSTVADAAQVMLDAGIRHLVVEDLDNDRRGVVSVRDLLEPLVEDAP
ncbi:MAG: CBS domain-containing protein [Actinomycetota bacterium]|jgi:CBS domain-containing protein|nr:CBS domain-containing protein [Actinomycetota bacterium]